jgi:hypothetical protein
MAHINAPPPFLLPDDERLSVLVPAKGGPPAAFQAR